ncbi:hypothetical protein A1QO_02735 [Vibrio genomosp. F10 str. ZF-129]|uniref:Uncharacterized protein n=1 Tax=Vibrio genomosp. F10 str. ZF-129 TaxID=1187848 RepID=A0A1E5BKC7_9VIBR|nr:hypothetical protein [Vibrio genomosp. F10]OEE38314.1 hypothetical protein A1QO_02735 [Vibrio genomosp. F10 str. ZF-129]
MTSFEDSLLNNVKLAEETKLNSECEQAEKTIEKDFIRKVNVLICPNCKHEFEWTNSIKNQMPVPSGSGGCKALAKCPKCGHVGCADRDKPKLKPKPNRMKNR